MQTILQLDMLRNAVATLRADGGTIALVPTMGALHDGHLSLVRAARGAARHVVASIFVNPRQFGPNEDFAAYPRQLAHDRNLLMKEGVALLWAPEAAEVYPPGFATTISVGGIGDVLCGADRPGHFDGVATVVCKLFNQVRPDMAFFGEKDWQQLAVIRRMARDLDLVQPAPDAIRGEPIVREPDGLAMSSRNAYLSLTERKIAAALPAAMRRAVAGLESDRPPATILDDLCGALQSAGFDRIDYAEVRDGRTLEQCAQAGDSARLFVAARIGKTRLIDNMAITPQG